MNTWNAQSVKKRYSNGFTDEGMEEREGEREGEGRGVI